MCSFSSSSVLYPGIFESKWVKFQRVLSADFWELLVSEGLFVSWVAVWWCVFVLSETNTHFLKAALKKRQHFHPHPTVRRAGTEFCKSSRQISSPACKNGSDMQLIGSVVSASFSLSFWNGSGDRGSEQFFRQTLQQSKWSRGMEQWVRNKATSPTCWITFCQESWHGELHKPHPLNFAWRGEQGLDLLGSHLWSFQVLPCSL